MTRPRDIADSINRINSSAADATAVTIDSSEQVGIGTTSPQQLLEVENTSGVAQVNITADQSSQSILALGDENNQYVQHIVSDHSDNSMRFHTAAGSGTNERMRIDSSGNLLVGTTSVPSSSSGGAGFDPNTNGRAILKLATTSTGNQGLAEFYNPNGQVGGIVVNGSATAYNTSSDYRLKENVTDITDGIERVKQLNPSRFNFIVDADTTVDGFLAHEAQEVVPEAVSGEKDAVDAEGNPDYQGIDQSKLVPLLTAALQEAVAKIETLEAKVTALENAD